MNLLRAASTIGGLTLVSRMMGFVRDMLLSRLLGAGLAADAFFLAFKLPNLFRRLFAEGAFSAAFVPMFAKDLDQPGGTAGRRAIGFAEDVLSVFLPALLLFTALAQAVMPALVWALASGFQDVPGKFEYTVELTRITFPYLMLISLASLMGGILNSLSRFAAAAAAPVILNIAIITALLLAPQEDVVMARWIAIAVTLSGFLQFLWLVIACRRAGVSLKLRWPRFTPKVRKAAIIALPAALGAGVYQVSQLIDMFFATRLEQGSVSYLNYADRLNQLPLGVIGIALSTAILPSLARRIGAKDEAGATFLQNRAIELAMFLTLPAAAALMILAQPLVQAFFQGGAFDAHDARWTGLTLSALAAGLPAYVLVKVLTPGFFAREDTRTPVRIALVTLVVNVALNFALIGPFRIAGLALSTALASWLNAGLLYWTLRRRDHFHLDAQLLRRLWRLLLASALMAAVLALMLPWASTLTGSGTGQRVLAICVLTAAGIGVYGAATLLLRAFTVAEIRASLKRGR